MTLEREIIRIVEFKSWPMNYYNEASGRKCNTVRRIDDSDERFIALRKGHVKYVCIVNSDFQFSYFIRKITDYTEHEGWAIISWNPEKRS